MTAIDLTDHFRRALGLNAQAWAVFVQENQAAPRVLDHERANLSKAAWQAIQEPSAWPAALALLDELWPYIELSGQWLQWQDLLEHALDVSRLASRRDAEAHLQFRLGELARIVGDTSTALARQRTALDLWRALGDAAGVGRALVASSQAHLVLGDSTLAEQCCREGLALLEEQDAPGELAIAYNNLGIICKEQGRLDEALAHYAQADQLFKAAGNLRGLAKLANNQGWVIKSQGDPAAAAACFRHAIELYGQIGDEVNLARTRVNLGIVHFETGQVAEALAIHQEVEAVFRRLGDRPWTARVLNNQGVFLQVSGRLAEAQTAYEQAYRLYREVDDTPSAIQTLANLVEGLLDSGRLDEARAVFGQIDALLPALANQPHGLLAGIDKQRLRLEDPAGASEQ